MRHFKILQRDHVYAGFSPTSFAVGLTLQSVQVGKYPQDRLRVLTLHVPFFFVNFMWRISR